MRPVGDRIREACMALEQHGPMGRSSICDHVDGVKPTNMSKYCSRAVRLGLMTVDRGLNTMENYSVFTVVPEWQDIVDKRVATKPAAKAPTPVVQKTQYGSAPSWAGVCNVFNMGGRA